MGCLVLTPRPDLGDSPLTNQNLLWFVNGSYSRGEKGNLQAGCAIITEYDLLGKGNLSQAPSTQPAELHG